MKVWGLGFGGWDLEFGVEGLDFRVWGLGLKGACVTVFRGADSRTKRSNQTLHSESQPLQTKTRPLPQSETRRKDPESSQTKTVQRTRVAQSFSKTAAVVAQGWIFAAKPGWAICLRAKREKPEGGGSAVKSRPESGPDCRICATFARLSYI